MRGTLTGTIGGGGSGGAQAPKLSDFSNPNQNLYISSSNIIIQWFAATGSNVTYKIKKFQGSNCSGTLLSDSVTSATSYSMTGLTDGQTYSLQLIASNDYGSSSPLCSPNIIVDMQAPVVTVIQPLTAVFIGGDSFDFSWSATDGSGAGVRSLNSYLVEKFDNGTCSGGAVNSQLQTASTLMWSGLADGSTYSVRIKAFDSVDNENVGTCSDPIRVSRTGMTLALKDPTTLSPSYARQASIAVEIGSDPSAVKWCLSETQIAPPVNGAAPCSGTGWLSSRPTSFNLSSGDGAKTIHVHFADLFGVTSQVSTQSSIYLDTDLPSTPSVELTDPISHSPFFTNTATVDLAITGDTDAVKWCTIEQDGASAPPTAPTFNSCTWMASRPVSQVLSAPGARKVYVYTQDVAGNVSLPGIAGIDYSAAPPTDFTISGVEGGGDVMVDRTLLGLPLKAHWSDASGESLYEITVLKNDGSTVECPVKTVVGDTTSYTYSLADCGALTNGLIYKLSIVAVSPHGNRKTATNAPFEFDYHTPSPVLAVTKIGQDQNPEMFADVDTASVELGARFKPLLDGSITALRFYKNASQTAAVTGHLWTAGGVLLGSATFAAGSQVGWQEAALSTPVAVTANTSYVVSYFAPQGRYAFTYNFFDTSFANPFIHFFASGDGGGNGLFKYGATSVFPDQSFKASYYFADVIFQYTPPPEIRGVFGGSDLSPDQLLTSGTQAKVSWEPWSNATSHEVTIYNDDAATVVCPTVQLAAPIAAHDFSGCSLTAGSYYRVDVVGKNGPATQAASNNLYRFFIGKAPILAPLARRTYGTPANGVNLTSLSFIPPDNSLLVVLVQADTDASSNITMNISDSAGHVWTQIIERNGGESGANSGYVGAWFAKVTVGSAMNVSVQRSAGSAATNRISFDMYAVRHFDVNTPIGAAGEGSSVNNNINPTLYVSTVSHSLGIGAATDWIAAGLPASTDVFNASSYAGEISVISANKSSATGAVGTPVTMNFDGWGTGGVAWNWIGFEIRPAP